MPVKSARTSRSRTHVGPPLPMTVERPEVRFRYLSGAPYEPVLRWRHGGFMFGPVHGNVTTPTRLLGEIAWAADNGCFSQGDSFSPEGFLRFLDRWSAYAPTCLFVVAPDVPFDHHATLERSAPFLSEIRARGYRAALAVQEGATPLNIPWTEIDAVFIAGGKPNVGPLAGLEVELGVEPDAEPDVDGKATGKATGGGTGKATRGFKTSQTARRIVIEARLRGKHAHVARCNSGRAVQAAYDMGAESVDGTFLAYAPDHNARRMEGWFERLCAHERRVSWGADQRFSVCPSCQRQLWSA
jgi:hypothetical protein